MRHAILIAAGIALSAAVLAADAPAPDLLHPKAPAGAKVFIVGPADGATVGPEFVVNFGVEGIAIAPATETTPNTGHHHLLIDGQPVPKGTVIPVSDTSLHFGKGQTETELTLPPGDHTLTLQFGDGAHRSYGPEWSKTITVHVK